MSFRSVPKSVTLNDLERRNGRYFALCGLSNGTNNNDLSVPGGHFYCSKLFELPYVEKYSTY